jgi:hypothetical protein
MNTPEEDEWHAKVGGICLTFGLIVSLILQNCAKP